MCTARFVKVKLLEYFLFFKYDQILTRGHDGTRWKRVQWPHKLGLHLGPEAAYTSRLTGGWRPAVFRSNRTFYNLTVLPLPILLKFSILDNGGQPKNLDFSLNSI